MSRYILKTKNYVSKYAKITYNLEWRKVVASMILPPSSFDRYISKTQMFNNDSYICY